MPRNIQEKSQPQEHIWLLTGICPQADLGTAVGSLLVTWDKAVPLGHDAIIWPWGQE